MFPKETAVHAQVSEVTLMYFPSIRGDLTEQSARGVGSDKRNTSLHIYFTRKTLKENIFSVTTRNVPRAFRKIDLPFEAMYSLK